MKKYNLILIFAIIISLYGCQEEEVLIQDFYQSINNEKYKVEVVDNMLYFESRDDYERTIDYLAQLGDENFANWEKEISFNSMRAEYNEEVLEEMGIDDDLLATLLNPDSQIRIKDNIFRIDMKNEIVQVTPAFTDSNNKKFNNKNSYREFSTDDEVLDILEGIETEDTQEKRRRYCRSAKKGYYKWKYNGVVIKYKVLYRRFGIYKSLQAKIKKVNTWGGEIQLHMKVLNGSFWKNKRRSGKISGSKGGNRRKYNIRPYRRVRKLKDYRYEVEFHAFVSSTGWAKVATVKIACNK